VLIARGHTRIRRADLRWALVFAPRMWCVTVRRSGLVLDTRFVSAAVEPQPPRTCVYLLLSGVFAVHGQPPFRGPTAFVISDEQLEGASGTRPLTFEATGQPYSAIELHLGAEDVTVHASAAPAELTLDAETWQAATAVAGLAEPDQSFQRDMATLLGRVASSGLVVPSTAAHVLDEPSKPFALLWRAVRPMIERFYLTPTLQEVGDAAGVSLRQVDRYMRDFVTSFALVGRGWRHTTRHVRLKLAVMLLSADGASVAEVASAVGYLSSDAMSRAFRDAGLPTPSVVQQQMRANL
jgi:AraC-like DNA-binding protein